MFRFTMLAVTLLVFAGAPNARGQETDEVKRLKERIELLEAKLKLAERENQDLKAENKQLKAGGAKKPADEPAVADDAFASGTVFEGRRQYTSLAASVQAVRLEITERKGTSFQGKLTIQNIDDKTKQVDEASTRVVNVKGQAPITGKGNVQFKTERSGKFEQSFTGKLNSGTFGFNFSGTNYVGQQSSGNGEIKVK
jgi:hypothetical protein